MAGLPSTTSFPYISGLNVIDFISQPARASATNPTTESMAILWRRFTIVYSSGSALAACPSLPL